MAPATGSAMNAATVSGPYDPIIRVSSAACQSPQPSGCAGFSHRYSYAAGACRNRPSQGVYGLRSGSFPEASRAPSVFPW